jgi:uncharacterized protein YhdP
MKSSPSGGRRRGRRQDFLRFIAESPVAGMINHFTDPFRAEGRGKLDLQLVLPLHKWSSPGSRASTSSPATSFSPTRPCRSSPRRRGRVEFTESQLGVRNGGDGSSATR